jgi:hypothetical protein
MIAYFILVHRYPQQFKRMFRAIHDPANVYLVHIDRGSGPAIAADIADFLAPYAGVEILPAKRAAWGGYSLVEAELRGMERLLAMDSRWTHFINLSGQDFPLKGQAYIRDFLTAHPGRQFIRTLDQHAVRPETVNRLTHRFVEAFGRIFRTRLPRRFMKDVTPYIGTQWKAVTRSFCAFAVHHPSARRFKKYYAQTFIADEGFFQTLMMNTPGHGRVVNDDLRTIDWVPIGTTTDLKPRVFGTADALRLTLSPDLFARKFNANRDSRILDLLEAHIATPAARRYLGEQDAMAPMMDEAFAQAA